MKLKILIIFITHFNLNLLAQDGADIWYVDQNKINSRLIGKFIQIDFFENSFGSNKFRHAKADTIKIKFHGEELEFKEIRNDTGFNNWFYQQYLESIKTFQNNKLRIEKMKILSVDTESITVKLFGHYFNQEGEAEQTEYLNQTVSFVYIIESVPPIS